uniref:DNA polymerase processivity factor n=1 Tax=Human betaherpesvirus 6A TaxID=32603 RepID=A0A3G1PK56_9BETA|nr:U27 [Human betaherpesvirus 6A]
MCWSFHLFFKAHKARVGARTSFLTEMERGSRDHHRDHRDHREHRETREPPTLAFHMKSWKTIHKSLKAFAKLLKENTTVTFTPQPSIIIQSAKNHLVQKLTIQAECLFLSDTDRFLTKTINNHIPLFESFMNIISNPEVTKMYIQHDSDLYTRVLVTASDTCTQASVPCVHGQEVVRDSGRSPLRIDLDHSTVSDVLKWLSPVTKTKRSGKSDALMAHIIVQVNPPTIKFVTEMNELEFSNSNKVIFYDVKSMRFNLSAKNLQQALSMCAVIKTSCSLRTVAAKDCKLILTSKSTLLTVEAFLTQEQLKEESRFERMGKQDDGKGDRSHKNEDGSALASKQEMQYKITNYMVPAKNGTAGSSLFNEKEDSESDDSMHFESSSNPKRQRCVV